MSNGTQPAPAANWRNPAEYPDPEQAPPDRWAWEFLRRDPKYQADYQRLCEDGRFYAVPLAANTTPYTELGLKVPASDEEHAAAIMAMFPDEEGGGPDLVAQELVAKLEFKWGVKPIASPQVADAWKWLSMRPAVVSTHLPEEFGKTLWVPIDGRETMMRVVTIFGPGGFTTKLRDTELLVRIDVAGPIEDQLKTAESLLKLYRERLKIKPYGERERRDLWAVYLRLLDARQAVPRPGWGELAAMLSEEFPEGWSESRARRAHKAACALRDGGWRFIAGRHPELEEERARKRKPAPGK